MNSYIVQMKIAASHPFELSYREKNNSYNFKIIFSNIQRIILF